MLGEGSLLFLVAGTWAYCVVSGLVPFVNAEIYLLAASAAAPRQMTVPLILAGTLGQMTAKVMMYGAGRGALRIPGARMKRWMAEAEAKAHERPMTRGGLVLMSAASGFPPFYVVSIACGMLRMRFTSFVALGFLGRLIRFSAIVLFPQVAKALVHS